MTLWRQDKNGAIKNGMKSILMPNNLRSCEGENPQQEMGLAAQQTEKAR